MLKLVVRKVADRLEKVNIDCFADGDDDDDEGEEEEEKEEELHYLAV